METRRRRSEHTCLVCGKAITYRFAICASCESTYGRSPLKWPEWLRFLWNDIQRERRREKLIHTHEITFTDLSVMTIDRYGINSRSDSLDEDLEN